MIFYNKNFDISENIVFKKLNDKNIRMICIDISEYILKSWYIDMIYDKYLLNQIYVS